jgi:hypothetical protein
MMIAAHDHVILDESFVMFRAANMGDKIGKTSQKSIVITIVLIVIL